MFALRRLGRRGRRRQGAIALAALLLGASLCAPLQAAALRVISLAAYHRAGLCRRAGRSHGGRQRLFRLSPAAAKLEKVASWNGINLERILALKPDLILAWHGGNPRRAIDQLAAFGIPIFYADPQRVEQIADDLDRLAAYSPHLSRRTAPRARFANVWLSCASAMRKGCHCG